MYHDNIIDLFYKSKFYNQIFTKYDDIIISFIGGSRIIGYNNKESDYDIIIFRDVELNYEEVPFKNLYTKLNNNIIIHWTYIPIKYMYHTNKSFLLGGLPKNCFISDKFIIYKNNRYEYFINNWLYNNKIKQKIFEIGLFKFYSSISDNLEFIKANNGIPLIPRGWRIFKAKDIYSLLFAANVYYKLNINKEFIMKVKNGNDILMSKEDTKYLFKLLEIIKNLICSDAQKIKANISFLDNSLLTFK